MLPLTKEELKPNQETKEYYICGKGILEKFAKDKNDWKEIEKIKKDGNETVETVSYKIRFIDSANLWQVDHQILLII